jgi:hypothetical protein
MPEDGKSCGAGRYACRVTEDDARQNNAALALKPADVLAFDADSRSNLLGLVWPPASEGQFSERDGLPAAHAVEDFLKSRAGFCAGLAPVR